MPQDEQPRVRLADAIAELRAEISRARQEGQDQDVRFAAKAIEVELSIDFKWAAEANAGVSKWIPFVDFGVKGSGGQTSLHKVKLTLEIADGGLISDDTGPAPVESDDAGPPPVDG